MARLDTPRYFAPLCIAIRPSESCAEGYFEPPEFAPVLIASWTTAALARAHQRQRAADHAQVPGPSQQNASSARLGARFTFLLRFGRAIGRNMATGGRHAAHAACCQTLCGRGLRWGFIWAGRIWELIILCAGIRRLTSNALTAVLFLKDQGNNIFLRDGDAPQHLVIFVPLENIR